MITPNTRACVGKNLANMELQIFIATIFRRYTFVVESPEKHVGPSHLAHLFSTDRVVCMQLETVEGFLSKPVSCRVGMKRREV